MQSKEHWEQVYTTKSENGVSWFQEHARQSVKLIARTGVSKDASTIDVLRAAKGELPLRKLFSKEQRQLYAKHAPEGIALDELAILGPIFVLKLRLFPPELGRRLVAEMWLYPDGSRILELSTRCETTEVFQVAAETRAFLVSKGVDLSGEQETKTRKALEFFARERVEAKT